MESELKQIAANAEDYRHALRADEDVRPMVVALDALAMQLKALDEGLGVLTDRLAPVLDPAGFLTQRDDGPMDGREPAPLVGHVQAMATQLRQQNDRLAAVIARLEV